MCASLFCSIQERVVVFHIPHRMRSYGTDSCIPVCVPLNVFVVKMELTQLFKVV